MTIFFIHWWDNVFFYTKDQYFQMGLHKEAFRKISGLCDVEGSKTAKNKSITKGDL